MADKRPNILLIMSDQQRLDTVSAYGLNDVCRTPNIDGLARRGVRFDRAFTPTAICAPARASILTGLYPHRHGVTGNDSVLNPDVKGMQEYLNDTGYRCGYAGKWHIDGARGPSEMGFTGKDFIGYAFPGSGVLPGLQFDLPPLNRPNHYEEYLKKHGFEPRVTKRFVGTNPTNQAQEMFALHDGPVESSIDYFIADETNRVVDEVSAGGEPFFVWANFWGPHSPSLVPEPYFSMYDPADILEHPGYRETFENKPYRQSLIEKLWGLGDYGWKGFQEIAARYFGHCTLIDDMVGKILGHLDERGLLENTVVIYASDHGDCMGAHRLIEKGEFMYDEIYRVPFIAAHPNCTAPGSVNDSFIYLHELAPTILDIAGVESHGPMDGESLKEAFLGDDTPNGRDEVYCVFDRHFTVVQHRMVRTRTHQLTFNSADQGELYDLVIDPYQLTNVYGRPEYEDVRVDLMGRMRGYMERLDDPLLGWFSRISGTY